MKQSAPSPVRGGSAVGCLLLALAFAIGVGTGIVVEVGRAPAPLPPPPPVSVWTDEQHGVTFWWETSTGRVLTWTRSEEPAETPR